MIAEESDPNQGTGPLGPARPSSEDLWDMHTQNESGKDAGRYLYRTHEVGANTGSDPSPGAPGGSQVSVTDLKTGITYNLAERNDWERFDGIAWTPWGTILAAEEVIAATGPDPQVPQAKGGLVYELFVDRDKPWKLDPSREPITAGDGTTDNVKDGVRARPAVGARSHEGLRFDRHGNLYGIAEGGAIPTPNQSGAIFRFVPDRKGDLAKGQLQAFKVEADRPAAGLRRGRVGRSRPSGGPGGLRPGGGGEGRDRVPAARRRRDGGEHRPRRQQRRPDAVRGGDRGERQRRRGRDRDRPAEPDQAFAYPYVGADAGNTDATFRNPDNVALDRAGNLAITEDSSTPPEVDVWIAAPPKGGKGSDAKGGAPASTVQRFATTKDCAAEPSGIYFAMNGTEEHVEGGPLEGKVDDETLFVHRQHAGNSSPVDQSVAIRPAGGGDDD